MCANCGPAGYNYDETLSTLRYANRAKNIRNKPKINEDPKDAMLREFQEEIQRLKAQIASGGGDGGGGGGYGGGGGGGGEIVETEYKEVERIVEVEKIVEIKGASEEELEEIRAKAAAEKARVKSAADAEMNRIVEEQAKTEKEKLDRIATNTWPVRSLFERRSGGGREPDAETLAMRAYRGLEPRLGEHAAAVVAEGRAGIASSFAGEGSGGGGGGAAAGGDAPRAPSASPSVAGGDSCDS